MKLEELIKDFVQSLDMSILRELMGRRISETLDSRILSVLQDGKVYNKVELLNRINQSAGNRAYLYSIYDRTIQQMQAAGKIQIKREGNAIRISLPGAQDDWSTLSTILRVVKKHRLPTLELVQKETGLYFDQIKRFLNDGRLVEVLHNNQIRIVPALTPGCQEMMELLLPGKTPVTDYKFSPSLKILLESGYIRQNGNNIELAAGPDFEKQFLNALAPDTQLTVGSSRAIVPGIPISIMVTMLKKLVETGVLVKIGPGNFTVSLQGLLLARMEPDVSINLTLIEHLMPECNIAQISSALSQLRKQGKLVHNVINNTYRKPGKLETPPPAAKPSTKKRSTRSQFAQRIVDFIKSHSDTRAARISRIRMGTVPKMDGPTFKKAMDELLKDGTVFIKPMKKKNGHPIKLVILAKGV